MALDPLDALPLDHLDGGSEHGRPLDQLDAPGGVLLSGEHEVALDPLDAPRAASTRWSSTTSTSSTGRRRLLGGEHEVGLDPLDALPLDPPDALPGPRARGGARPARRPAASTRWRSTRSTCSPSTSSTLPGHEVALDHLDAGEHEAQLDAAGGVLLGREHEHEAQLDTLPSTCSTRSTAASTRWGSTRSTTCRPTRRGCCVAKRGQAREVTLMPVVCRASRA